MTMPNTTQVKDALDVSQEVFSVGDVEFKATRTNPYGFWYLTLGDTKLGETFTSLLESKEGAKRFLQMKAKKK